MRRLLPFVLLAVVLGCGQPEKPPLLRVGDLVLDGPPSNAGGFTDGVIVTSVGVVAAVDYGGLSPGYWNYLVVFDGYHGWFKQENLRRLGQINWRELNSMMDSAKAAADKPKPEKAEPEKVEPKPKPVKK